MVHFLLSSLSCFLMGSDKFCSSIIAKKLWAIEPKRFSFSMWIIVNEPIQCSPSNVHGPRPCYSLIWAKLLSSVKRTRKYGWPLCNLMLAYFYRLFFFRTIHFLNPKNKTVIVQKFYIFMFLFILWFNSNDNYLNHFWPYFRQLYVGLSQNWGSDSHFEVLNGSKSWILKIWQPVSFWSVKTHFGKLALK